MKTSKCLRDSLNKRWRCNLIEKLLGGTIDFKTLEEKIQQLWAPKTDLELIDVGEEYFVVRFSSFEDRKFAMEEGPWLIFGHYLMVREWWPEF